jgi:hypothetical protein
MIQLFLIVIILVILIVKLNTKETFFQESCGKTVLYAMNSYYIDTDDNKKPCIDLIVDEDIRNKSGYILIKNKHNNQPPLITEIKNVEIKEFDITTSASALASNLEMTRNRLQLSDESLELNNTYLITLNIKNEDGNYTIYDTIEITFKDVNLSNDDLNLNNNCNNIIESLKNKKIILNI